MDIIFLVFLALLPGFILLYLILFMDRAEKEPLGLVLKIMLLGALSVVPTAIIELFLAGLPIASGQRVLDAVLTAFLRVAWVEELFKLLVVLIFAWKNKNFNEENDGIVYVGASALGFAMLENVFYVLGHGIGTGVLRAVTAMPLHCFTGVLMGYFVGIARLSQDKKTRRWNILKGFLLAFILHGVYDALLFTRTPAGILIFPMTAGLFIFGIKFLKKGRALSKARWDETRQPVVETVTREHLLVSANPKNQLWKIIISRSLFTAGTLFWAALIIEVSSKSGALAADGMDLIMGGIILSFLPLLIAVMLEISYRRNKRLYQTLESKKPPAAVKPEPAAVGPSALLVSIPPAEVIAPPGQMWRIVVSRTFLTISGLVWAFLILAFISNAPEYASQWHTMVIGGMVVSFFPIYTGIMLEHSYRRRKKRFNELRQSLPLEEIKPEDLDPAPAGQLWKILISRTIFGLCGLFWVVFLWDALVVNPGNPSEFFNNSFGGIILTAVPITLAALLEGSYRKRKKAFEAHTPGEPTAPAAY